MPPTVSVPAGRVPICCFVLFGWLSTAIAAAGQPGSDAVPPMPRAFAGGSFGFATRDPEARMRLYQNASSRTWSIDTGIGLGSRLSAGVEYSKPSVLTGSTVVGVGRTQIAGREVEHVVAGVLRGRLAGRGAWAVDVVGGAGILVHQHFRGSCTPPQEPRTKCATEQRTLYGRSPAIVAGVDLPVQAAPHLAVVLQPRYFVLRRGDSPAGAGFQDEHRSSTRFAVSAGARVMW